MVSIAVRTFDITLAYFISMVLFGAFRAGGLTSTNL